MWKAAVRRWQGGSQSWSVCCAVLEPSPLWPPLLFLNASSLPWPYCFSLWFSLSSEFSDVYFPCFCVPCSSPSFPFHAVFIFLSLLRKRDIKYFKVLYLLNIVAFRWTRYPIDIFASHGCVFWGGWLVAWAGKTEGGRCGLPSPQQHFDRLCYEKLCC